MARPSKKCAAPSTNGANGKLCCRDEKGRFLPGNPGGPGNPFGKRVAAYRAAFLDAVTTEDLAEICRTLIEKAKAGDMAAAKLVLSWTIGKPEPAPELDKIDVTLGLRTKYDVIFDEY